MNKIIVCLLSFLLFFFSMNSVLAADKINFPQASNGQINDALSKTAISRLLPSSRFYFFVTIKEFVDRILQPSSAKRTEFDLTLSGKRLKESYLLLSGGDVKNASSNLHNYSQRISAMENGLAKAKTQNQDVTNLVSAIAEDLRNQEVIFYAIGVRAEGLNDQDNFGENYNQAAFSFVNAVWTIDNFSPGIKNRFKSATGSAEPINNLMNSAPKTPGFIEASASTKPNRIIY